MRGSIGILAIAILTCPGVSQGQGTISTSAGNGSFTSSGDGGPASSAGIGFPAGVAVDGAGNIYIADALNSRVRKVNTAGVISTVAGNGFPFFGGDGGPGSSASIALMRSGTASGSGDGFSGESVHRGLHQQSHPQSGHCWDHQHCSRIE